MNYYPLMRSAGLLAWDIVAAIIIVLALARLVRSPRELFAYGALSKCGWAIACIWFRWHWDAALVPTGALVATWHTGAIARRNLGAGTTVPFATGRAPRHGRR